jgi:cell division septation protein DedD
MAMRGNRGGGGDRVLESRHVIGLFLLMLVFSGVFFALGYVMGRNQYDGQVRAESTPRATPDPVAARADVPSRRSKNSQSSVNSANSASAANSSNTTNSASSGNSGWGSVSSSPSAATNSRETASAPNATPDESATPSSDWNFYNSSKNPPDDRLKPAGPGDPATSAMSPAAAGAGKTPKPTPVSNKATATASTAAPVTAGSPFPPGTYVLQVAAMRQSVDASAVATSLRAKHFPAIVVNPTTDKYYHVQVGPYHDVKSADVAKKGLESAGFKAIVKH